MRALRENDNFHSYNLYAYAISYGIQAGVLLHRILEIRAVHEYEKTWVQIIVQS